MTKKKCSRRKTHLARNTDEDMISNSTQLKEEIQNETDVDADIDFEDSNLTSPSVLSEFDGNQSIINDDSYCVNLSIESVDGSMRFESVYDNYEQIMYSQISTQITKMLQTVLVFNEKEERVIFETENSERHLEIAKIIGDGNCLFRALAHQPFNEKLNTAKQNNSTIKLRADVVRFIKDNYVQFEHELKGCVFDLDYRPIINDIENECQLYVHNILTKDGSWGGSESIKAVSSIYSVNILMFNEYGPCKWLQF